MWKQTGRQIFLLAILVGIVGVAVWSPKITDAAAGINQQMAFEGKLVNTNGTNIANGTYNMEFKIYTGGTATGGGTLQWTEDYLVGGTGGVTLNDGTFEVNLGAITSLSSVNWNSDTLWLSLQIGNSSTCTISTTFQSNCGGDGEMSPYIRLTSVPYAFNALELGGATAASYGTLAGTQTWAAGNTFTSSITANGGIGITGLSTQSFGSAVTANADSRTVTNSNASATLATVNGLNISLVGGANSNSNKNALNAINFPNVTTVTNNIFTGLSFGTGYNSLLNYNGSTVINGAGLVQTAFGGTGLSTALAANGSLLIGNGSGLTLATLSNNGGVTITNGSGSIGLAVAYGTAANTAAQGNTAFTFNGSGNLTGSLSGTAGGGFTTTTLAVNGTPTFTGLTLNGSEAVTLSSGVTANANSYSITNSNSTATASTVNALNLALVGGTNSNSNANTINGLNFANVTGLANNTFNGLNFGTGYTNGLNFTSATGITNFINTPTADLTSAGALTGLTGYTQGSGTFGVTGISSFTGTTTVNTGTADQLSITSGTNIPTIDQLAITNTGSSGVTAAGVNGLSIAYKGGAAAVESAAERIDLTPGTTSGGTWSGLRVVPNATGAVAGVTENGLKVDNLTSPGSGTENGISVGTGWDNILQSANTTITQTGAITTAGVANLNGGVASSGALSIDATGALNLGPTNTTSIVIGGNTAATLTEKIANSSTTAFQLQTAGATAFLSADTTNNKLQVGSGTADATEILLQLDTYNTFTDSGSCTTTSNQGALYYNSASAAIRACVNGSWEDAVTTSGLGILAFGVIPDSANAGAPGDIAGVSNYSNSPCKVVWTATQQVTVEPCLAYSGGRKVIVPSTALSTAALAANTFSNVCLTAAGGQPALGTGNTTETSAALPAFSANNPVLCLATVKTSATAGNVGFIWDTRTFTNVQKEFATVNSVNNNGFVVIGTTTLGTVQTTATAASGPIRGVVVATAGTASTTAVNAIIAVQGTAFVHFVSGGTATINNYLETFTTAGYGTSVASGGAVSNYIYGGLLETSISTSCTTTNTVLTACQYAPLVDFRPNR